MKLILLLLLSFNAFAEYQYNILPTDSTWAKSRIKADTEIEAKEKLLKFIEKSKVYTGEWDLVEADSIATKKMLVDEVEVDHFFHPTNYTVVGEDTATEDANELIKQKIAQNGACGLAVRDHIGFLNIKGSIDPLDVMAISPNLINLLLAGTMDTARAVVVAIDPETTVIDQAYKDSVLAKIDECKVTW
jgi:hypothetical protein